jgi:hypothetical protein
MPVMRLALNCGSFMQSRVMLREIRNTRQIPGESPRRWFHSSKMDLIVWLHDEVGSEITGFQLCYDKTSGEKALHWKAGSGFSHMDVDDGENTGGKHKATPLLVPDGAFDGSAVHQNFLSAASNLPNDIRRFIEEKLQQAS